VFSNSDGYCLLVYNAGKFGNFDGYCMLVYVLVCLVTLVVTACWCTMHVCFSHSNGYCLLVNVLV
jgi:hypothetical protein